MAKIDALGYVVAQSTDLGQWVHYGEQVLGMSTQAVGDALYLKMDERDYRILVIPGDEDRYYASGWEVTDQGRFDAAVAALKEAGVEVTAGSEQEKALRQVSDLASFTDAAGNRQEISVGYSGGAKPFVSPIGVSGFKTGEMGMGHTVLPALPFDETEKLYTDVLGFRVSDEFGFQPAPDAPVMRMHFLHCNGRHHSLAFGEMPNRHCPRPAFGDLPLPFDGDDATAVTAASVAKEKKKAKA
ncbi:MAG: VOC family protein, partial [Nevskiales bacterium]